MSKMSKELMKKNNEREKEILKENDEIYTNMIVYLRAADMTQYNQELVRQDIIEMILDGQQRGDNIEQVMGSSYKEICDEIMDAMPKRTKKEKIISYLTVSLTCLWILGIGYIGTQVMISFIKKTEMHNFTLTAGQIISGILIVLLANFIVMYVCKTSFTEKKENKIVSFLKNWAISFAIFTILIVCNLYLSTPMIVVPVTGAIVFVGIAFGAERLLSSVF